MLICHVCIILCKGSRGPMKKWIKFSRHLFIKKGSLLSQLLKWIYYIIRKTSRRFFISFLIQWGNVHVHCNERVYGFNLHRRYTHQTISTVIFLDYFLFCESRALYYWLCWSLWAWGFSCFLIFTCLYEKDFSTLLLWIYLATIVSSVWLDVKYHFLLLRVHTRIKNDIFSFFVLGSFS